MLMILIPGLIIVALMVWASTRIKRDATKAFEREVVEAERFSLSKPNGFLSLADPPDGLLFSAYSKDFGRDEAERIRQATIELRRLSGGLDEAVEQVKADAAGIISEQMGVIGERKCANIVIERVEQGVALESHHKLIAELGAVYQLVVDVLPEHKDELQPKLDEVLGSFSLS